MDHVSIEPPQPDPHPSEEDPEQHMGEVIRDPWDDPHQTDWTSETVGEV